jgi:hypothetical protein
MHYECWLQTRGLKHLDSMLRNDVTRKGLNQILHAFPGVYAGLASTVAVPPFELALVVTLLHQIWVVDASA